MNIAQSPKQRFALIIIIASVAGLLYKGITALMAYFSTKDTPVVTTASTIASNDKSVLDDYSFAKINSFRTSAIGTITAGKISFKIQNVGTENGTVKIGSIERTLKPDESIEYNTSLSTVALRTLAIEYNASETEFIIDTVSL